MLYHCFPLLLCMEYKLDKFTGYRLVEAQLAS